jgi:hypothetical protein
MKNKFFIFGLLALIAFGMTGCPGGDDEDTWQQQPGNELPNNPRLERLRLSGTNVNLSSGAADTPAATTPIPITFQSSEVDEDDNPTHSMALTVSIRAEDQNSVTIEYAVSASATDPGTFSSASPSSLKNGDYFWIKVTAEGGAKLYYVIKVTVNFDPNALGGGDFTIIYNPVTRNYVVGDPIAPLTAGVSVKAMYQYQWYSNTKSSTTGGSAIMGAGGTMRDDEFTYTPTDTAAGDYYYYVVITNLVGSKASSPAQITINTSAPSLAANAFKINDTKYNYVRGIGGTGSFMFRSGSNADASPDADVAYIDKLFGEIGCNNLRIMVQDDYLNYIENKVQSRNQAVFYHDAKKNFFAVIRRVNEYGGYVFANPWTAPASMKTNNSTMGIITGFQPPATENAGNLRTASYIAYADHLRDFLKWLNANNAPIFCIGILNEPDYGNTAAYEGMGLTRAQTIDWFNLVGHYTTQEATPKNATATNVTYISDPIPGYGGGGPTHHVLAMSGDSAGNVSTYMGTATTGVNISQLAGGTKTNNSQEVVGRHYYYSSGPRFTEFVGAATSGNGGNPGTTWVQRGTTGHGPLNPFSPTAYNMGTVLLQSPQMFPPESAASSVKREIWQTEHDINHGTSVTPTGTAWQYWNSAYAVLNWVDHTLRGCGESLSSWWFSSSFSGYVTSNHTLGWPSPYYITPRGRAVAHYARYVNETWLLGIERTRGSLTFNNASSTFAGSSTVPKITAFEDIHGQYISVVMFAPGTPTSASITGGFGNGGTDGIDNPAIGSVNVGKVELILPDGYEAVSATAMRSWGHKAGEYWQDEPVFLSADGKSAEVTLPGGNVISVKFMLKDRPDPIPNDPRGRRDPR